MRRVVEEINNRYLTCEAQDPYHLIIYLKMQIRICRNTILVDHSSHFAVNLLWPRLLFTISHHVTNLWSMKLKRYNLVAIVSYKLLRKIIRYPQNDTIPQRVRCRTTLNQQMFVTYLSIGITLVFILIARISYKGK